MAYTPPAYNAVNFSTESGAYTPPVYNEVNFSPLTVPEGAVFMAETLPVSYLGKVFVVESNPLSYTLTVPEGAVSNSGVFPLGYLGVVVSPHKFPMEWSGIASSSTFVLGNPIQVFQDPRPRRWSATAKLRIWYDTPRPRGWYESEKD